jgi:hypothetical protein
MVDLGIHGKTIKMDISETGWEGVSWIYLAEDEDRWGLLRTQL